MLSESEVLEVTFGMMNDMGLDYVVMNKYEQLPFHFPSDIDIAISSRDFVRLDDFISELSKKIDYLLLFKIWHGYQKRAYILVPKSSESPIRLHLDFFIDFCYSGLPKLIPFEEIKSNSHRYKQFSILNSDIELVFTLMRRIIKNDFYNNHIDKFKALLLEDIVHNTDYLIKTFGDNGAQVADFIKEGNVEGLVQLRNKLFSDLKNISNRNASIFCKMKFNISQLRRAFYRYMNPVGFSVAIIATDGAGKTAVIKGVRSYLEKVFHRTSVIYTRPQLFPNMGRLKFWQPYHLEESNPHPHDKPLHPKFKSLVRFFYYLLDFILGFYIKVSYLKALKHLVIFDRYYYDYLVDLKRYQMDLPKWLPKGLLGFIPAPDLVVVLDGSPEEMYKRKQELPLPEVRRQVEAFKKNAELIPNCVIINNDGDIQSTVQKLVSEIIARKASQTTIMVRKGLVMNL